MYHNRLLLPIDRIASNLIEAHASTNHYYDDYLPYEFHLRMVVHNIKEDEDVAKKILKLYDTVDFRHVHYSLKDVDPVKFEMDHLIGGGWAHDGPEDARLTFNDVVAMTSRMEKAGPMRGKKDVTVAMIARAVTSDPTGINREHRMTPAVYERIQTTPGATFVKLEDRKANVQYGIMTGSSMSKKYKEENPEFIKKLSGTAEFDLCLPLVDDLEKLFKKIK